MFQGLAFQSLTIGAAALGLILSPAGAARAQSNGGSMNAGYGHASTSDGNSGVTAGTRDANGNRIIIDGIIQGGLDQSSITSTSFGGVSSLGSGAGSAGATAIGNNLSVVTQGSWNTVIINSTQTNTGTVTATSTTGGVGGTNGN
jgi:holdfast attachment protein HfaA